MDGQKVGPRWHMHDTTSLPFLVSGLSQQPIVFLFCPFLVKVRLPLHCKTEDLNGMNASTTLNRSRLERC